MIRLKPWFDSAVIIGVLALVFLLQNTGVVSASPGGFPLAPAPVAVPPGQALPVAVTLDPAASTVCVSQAAAVSIRSAAVPGGLHGAQLELAYNPAVIEVLAVDIGPLLQGSGGENQAGGYFQLMTIDPAAGSVLAVITMLAPATSVSASGVVARLSIRCKSTGNSCLDFTGTTLTDRGVPRSPAWARMEVSPVVAVRPIARRWRSTIHRRSGRGKV